MNPRKLVAGMTAATALVILLTTVLFKDEIHDWLFAIRRVRTWGDLLAQKPIELSDGVIIRLGIEDTRCPQGTGVLLYCLTEGYDPSSRIGSHHTEGGLGPLEVSVVEEGAVFEGQKSEIELLDSLRKKTTARLLFARSIPVPRSGRCHVTVSEHGKALRHVTVKGTDESTHPWLGLVSSQNLIQLPGYTFDDTLIPCAGAAVTPLWLGFRPYGHVDASHVNAPLPLPRLLPDGSKCQLELRQQANSLIVTSTGRIGFRVRNFAARWWVNGMPHVAEALKSYSGQRGRRPVEQFRFNLDFASVPGDLQSGDRVSLQLLYSDQGWSSTDTGEQVFFLPSEQRILLSNRIELTVP